MSELDGQEFDVIVLGTGLVESIVAAAAARVGKGVLHLDTSDFYGGAWGTFNLDELAQTGILLPPLPAPTAESTSAESTDVSSPPLVLRDGESLQRGTDPLALHRLVSNVKLTNHLAQHVESQQADESAAAAATAAATAAASWGAALRQSRRFLVDVVPKPLFSRGDLVNLLISSNVGRYLEFKAVEEMYFVPQSAGDAPDSATSAPIPVPCSRADVFSTAALSIIDKRVLMKLLTLCLEIASAAPGALSEGLQEYEQFKDMPFTTWLRENRRLSPSLLRIVLHTIAMVDEPAATPAATPAAVPAQPQCTVREGVQRICSYIASLGRYGKTPFLWSLYGLAEIAQAFCRLCAVFGGTYILRARLDALILKPGAQRPAFAGLLDAQKNCVRSSWLVTSAQNLLPAADAAAYSSPKRILRGVLVTTQSIFGQASSHADSTESAVSPNSRITITTIPPNSVEGNSHIISLVELGASAGVAPQGLLVVHLTCTVPREEQESPENVFRGVLNRYFQSYAAFAAQGAPDAGSTPSSTTPVILWSLFFEMQDHSEAAQVSSALAGKLPENVLLCAQPSGDVSFAGAVDNARSIFHRMFPGEEFLPSAPNPEDIAWDSPDNRNDQAEVESDATVDVQ